MELRLGHSVCCSYQWSVVRSVPRAESLVDEWHVAPPPRYFFLETRMEAGFVQTEYLHQLRAIRLLHSFFCCLVSGGIACFVACFEGIEAVFATFAAAVKVGDTFTFQRIEAKDAEPCLAAAGYSWLKALRR